MGSIARLGLGWHADGRGPDGGEQLKNKTAGFAMPMTGEQDVTVCILRRQTPPAYD